MSAGRYDAAVYLSIRLVLPRFVQSDPCHIAAQLVCTGASLVYSQPMQMLFVVKSQCPAAHASSKDARSALSLHAFLLDFGGFFLAVGALIAPLFDFLSTSDDFFDRPSPILPSPCRLTAESSA